MVWKCTGCAINWGCYWWYGCTGTDYIDCYGSATKCAKSTVVYDGTSTNKNCILKRIWITDCYKCAQEVCNQLNQNLQQGQTPYQPDWIVFVWLNLGNLIDCWFVYRYDMPEVASITGLKPSFSPILNIIRWDSDFRAVYRFNENYITSYIELKADCPPGKICCVGMYVIYCYEASPYVRIKAVTDIPTLKQQLGGKGIRAAYALQTVPISESDPYSYTNTIDIIVDRSGDVDRVVDALNELGYGSYIVEKSYE